MLAAVLQIHQAAAHHAELPVRLLPVVVMVVPVVATVAVATVATVVASAKCTLLLAQAVAMRLRFLSSPVTTDQFTAAIVSSRRTAVARMTADRAGNHDRDFSESRRFL